MSLLTITPEQKFTGSLNACREITRNSGLRGYRPRQASILAEDRSLNSRNARQINKSDWLSVKIHLKNQWSPEQIATEVPISHETIYRHIYADKAIGGDLYQHLRCQKRRRKRYAGGRDRRGQIIGRRPISDRPKHIEERRQIGHWEGDTLIGNATNTQSSHWSSVRAVTRSLPRLRTRPLIRCPLQSSSG